MLKSNRMRRCIAATLLLILTTQIVAPATVYALTSGPTAPEYTSFEPVDTTDMVNHSSGDFTYNIPIIEVPGPEGGYPLSLAYHAGTQPNEEASWVGLGWNLNPGAINRTVNGLPDDNNVLQYNRTDFWEGGTTKRVNIGVTVGLQGIGSADFGLIFAQDTYQGFGIGFQIGAGIGYHDENSGIGVGLHGSLTIGPYGSSGASASIGIHVSNEVVQVNFGVTFSYGSRPSYGFSVSQASNGEAPDDADDVKVSMGLNTSNIVGVNISSDKNSRSFSASAGAISTSLSNSLQNKISQKSRGIDFGFIGFSKTRYWIDQTETSNAIGTLYFTGNTPSYNENLFDSYELLEEVPKYQMVFQNSVWQTAYEPNPKYLSGGALPDFDNYSVLGQGLSGDMKPYMYQGRLSTQKARDDGGNTLVEYSVGSGLSAFNHVKPHFRFVGDFSNYYRQDNRMMDNPNPTSSGGTVNFDPNPQYGTDGYNTSLGILAGSENINYYTNDEIINGLARNTGFIEPSNCLGFTRSISRQIIFYNTTGGYYTNSTGNYLKDQIGGYSITNSSGVTYHYGLPVYADRQTTQSEKINPTTENGGYGNNIQEKAAPYAYTWLLTTITGPDFVDRDAPGTAGYGKANTGDWGYWVNFNYGQSTQDYFWRNPSFGYHSDPDLNFRDHSVGRKELYFLNSISSRTHTLIFEKGVRKDGFGESANIFLRENTSSRKRLTNAGEIDFTKAQLKLNKIYLINNTDLSLINTYAGTIPGSYSIGSNNIIDEYDINSVRTQLEEKSLRIIDFDYDYSLCKGTPNSNSDNAVSGGRLTLRSVNFRGKGGVSKIPAMKFDYELPHEYQKKGTLTMSATYGIISTSVPLSVGDLLAVNDASNAYLGVVLQDLGSGGYKIGYGSFYSPGSVVEFKTTKNPPYHKDYYDKWGMYKSDLSVSIMGMNDKLSRQTNSISAKSYDVWSLRRIRTSLGANMDIEYEADSYSTDVFKNSFSLFSVPGTISNNSGIITAKVDDPYNELPPLTSIFSVGQTLKYAYLTTVVLSGVGTAPITAIDNVQKTISFNVGTSSGGLNYIAITFFHNKQLETFGGGLRVKKISLNKNDLSIIQNYEYSKPGSTSSSGVNSYDPDVTDPKPLHYIQPPYLGYKYYYEGLNDKEHFLLRNIRQLPSPGVMYEYVTVSSSVKNISEALPRTENNKTTYQFDVLNKGNSFYFSHPEFTSGGQTNYRGYEIKKFFSNVGSLKRIIQYDGAGKKLMETVNHYLHDNIAGLNQKQFFDQYDILLGSYNFQGYINQRFSEIKRMRKSTQYPLGMWYMTLTSLQDYPLINTGTTTIDYRSNIKTEVQNIAYDLYNGNVTKSISTDANGNRFMTEVVPAYTKYAGMGIKAMDQGRKNMLSQNTATYVYKVDNNNTKLGLVSAQIQTWSNSSDVLMPDNTTVVIQNNATNNGVNASGNVWRQKSVYSWMPEGKTTDGITPIAQFSDYSWTNPSGIGIQWKKASETTLFNVFSTPLEAMDINGNYAASKTGYDNSRVIIAGSPAKYHEIAYTGAEDYTENGNSLGAGFTYSVGTPTVQTSVAHTGAASILLDQTEAMGYTVDVSKLNTSRDYIISAWVKGNSTGSGALIWWFPQPAKLFYAFNGNIGASITSTSVNTVGRSASGWFLVQMRIPAAELVGKTTLTVGCRYDTHNDPFNMFPVSCPIDDFRFQPLNASASAYVYDKFSGELTYVLDNNNLYTRYEYDANGRLIKTYKEAFKTVGEKLISEFDYNYSQGAGRFFSSEINKIYTKQNCTAPTPVGSNVMVNVPHGQFVSNVSQQDADNQAEAYAQSQANTLGTCSSLIYARLEMGNYNYWWPNSITYREDADVYMRFYSDANCTVPLTLPQSIVFRYGTDYNPNCCWGSYYETTVSVSAGVSEYFLGRFPTYEQYWYDDPWSGYPTSDYSTYAYTMKNNGPLYFEKPTYFY